MVDTSSECTIGNSRARRLSSFARLIYPLSCYRIYNIEYAEFMCSRSLLEMCVDLLNQDCFGLWIVAMYQPHTSWRMENEE